MDNRKLRDLGYNPKKITKKDRQRVEEIEQQRKAENARITENAFTASVFHQLRRFDKFVDFMEENYRMERSVDHETKMIGLVVYERTPEEVKEWKEDQQRKAEKAALDARKELDKKINDQFKTEDPVLKILKP